MKLNNRNNSCIRFITLIIILLVFIFIMFCFCCRKRFSCVDVKGELKAVNINSRPDHEGPSEFLIVFGNEEYYDIVEVKGDDISGSTYTVTPESAALSNGPKWVGEKIFQHVNTSEFHKEDWQACVYDADIKKVKDKLVSRNVVAVNVQENSDLDIVYKNENCIFTDRQSPNKGCIAANVMHNDESNKLQKFYYDENLEQITLSVDEKNESDKLCAVNDVCDCKPSNFNCDCTHFKVYKRGNDISVWTKQKSN